MEEERYTIPYQFAKSAEKHWNRPMLAYVSESPYTYREAETLIKSLISFLTRLGVKKSTKVAILSENNPNWGISYLAITGMGAVVVPILPGFSAVETGNVLQHSETRCIIVSDKQMHKLKSLELPFLKHIIDIDDFAIVSGEKTAYYQYGKFDNNGFKVYEDDLAAIIYTSGTTGKSKGVMLSHRNICFTVHSSGILQPIEPSDRFLSLLPLSHTYENSLGFLLPVFNGASVYYMKQAAAPSVMLKALKEVKPTMMLTVPMIIEKIYRNRIAPSFKKNKLIARLYRNHTIKMLLHRIAGKKLMKTFGGKIRFFGVGGAKLDPVVEQFLLDARFPLAIGYGLTETAPLLAGTSPRTARLQSTGPAIQGVELKINNPDAETGVGEIWARGKNVMMGYYKEPEITAEVITPDGWFRTGDLGVLSADGFLSIRGRNKNVILGSGGENIFPEDIESLINNFDHVVESLVVEENGGLVALVHFNKEEIEQRYNDIYDKVSDYSDRKIEELKAELQIYINKQVSKYARLNKVIYKPTPFEKTATQKIKRFLY